MVIVDLYPFEKTVAENASETDIIEKIDIGGPAMVRASAKNFKDVTVITDIKDYSGLTPQIINKIIENGNLERSNVDVTSEMITMLKAQQAFSGVSRLLQTEVDITKRLIDG